MVSVIEQAFGVTFGSQPVEEATELLHEALAGDEEDDLEPLVHALGAPMDALLALRIDPQADGALALDVLQADLRDVAAGLDPEADIEETRAAFAPLSETLAAAVRSFGLPRATVYELKCPMALGTGAHWLQDTQEVRNPYYGDSMLDCGSLVATLAEVDR